jgi:hypothetical protein
VKRIITNAVVDISLILLNSIYARHLMSHSKYKLFLIRLYHYLLNFNYLTNFREFSTSSKSVSGLSRPTDNLIHF